MKKRAISDLFFTRQCFVGVFVNIISVSNVNQLC